MLTRISLLEAIKAVVLVATALVKKGPSRVDTETSALSPEDEESHVLLPFPAKFGAQRRRAIGQRPRPGVSVLSL